MGGEVPDFSDNFGNADKIPHKGPASDSAPLAGLGASMEPRISHGGSPEHAIDIVVDKVFASVVERLQAAALERGRARFEIETDHGQRIRVRLAVDSNVVSARIDAPNEQLRDLLAGHAWELGQRLETEGLIPSDIEFCLAGGRQQAAEHEASPDIRNAIVDTPPEEDLDNLTMVETETYAFESWA
jgi:hypothetical protein